MDHACIMPQHVVHALNVLTNYVGQTCWPMFAAPCQVTVPLVTMWCCSCTRSRQERVPHQPLVAAPLVTMPCGYRALGYHVVLFLHTLPPRASPLPALGCRAFGYHALGYHALGYHAGAVPAHDQHQERVCAGPEADGVRQHGQADGARGEPTTP
jgi:hypothetical protein